MSSVRCSPRGGNRARPSCRGDLPAFAAVHPAHVQGRAGRGPAEDHLVQRREDVRLRPGGISRHCERSEAISVRLGLLDARLLRRLAAPRSDSWINKLMEEGFVAVAKLSDLAPGE